MNVYDVSSIAGIIALTTILVSAVKGALKDVPWVNKVPVFLYTLIIAVVMTLLAHWSGYLGGSIGVLVSQAVIGAIGAGGAYNVITGSAMQSVEHAAKDPTTIGDQSIITPPVVTQKDSLPPPRVGMPLLFLGFSSLLLTGCGSITSTQSCYKAAETYRITLETVQELRVEGVIPEDAIKASKPYRVAAKAALVAWRQAAETNNTTGAKTNLQKFLDATKFIQQMLEAYTSLPVNKMQVDHGNSSGAHTDQQPRPSGRDSASGESPSDQGRTRQVLYGNRHSRQQSGQAIAA